MNLENSFSLPHPAFIFDGDKIEAQYPLLHKSQMTNPTYTIQMYVNGYLTSLVGGLSPNEAYSQGVPGEALDQVPGSRWHAMLRGPALERLEGLLAGESLRVCWQDPSQNNWSGTEHVLIIKDPIGVHYQGPAVPAPVPVAGLHMNLLNDIQTLINNMIMNQDNQQNLINNIRNRLVIMNHPANPNANPNAIPNNHINPNANGFQS